MSSLKQLIVAALYKVATPVEGEEQVEYASPELARDAFVAKVVAELFPESAEVPAKPKKAPKPEAKPEAKPESPKKPKASPKKPKAEAKVESPKPEAKVESPKPEEAKPEAKGKRGPMSEEAKAAMAAKRAATMAAKKAAAGSVEAVTEQLAQMTLEPAPAAAGGGSPKKPKAKKAKEESGNLAKIDPTWRKTLKEADKANAKELEPALLTYLNAMPKEAFHGKTAKEHVADFLASRGGAAEAPAAAPVATTPADLVVVEFQGKEYYVNEETKRVYEGVMGEDGTLTVTRPVGYVGMADFKDMSLE